MKKIIAFAGSNSSKSINYQLLNYAASMIEEYEVKVLDIRNWIIPIYSVDMDEENFTPKEIQTLINLSEQFDAFIISTPEHNGGPTAFFKNITDWISRRSDKIFRGRPVLLMSASPGRSGAINSRNYYERHFSRLGLTVVSTYSLPSFRHNMINGKLLPDECSKLKKAISQFTLELK